jgi:hypothetical protein
VTAPTNCRSAAGVDGIEGIEGRPDMSGRFKLTSLSCWIAAWQSPVQFQFQTVPEPELAAAAAGVPEEFPQSQFQFQTSGAPGA